MSTGMPNLEVVRNADDVLAGLRARMRQDGFQRRLDDSHWVTFISRGPTLMVSFESLETTLASEETGLPLGMEFVEDSDWSLLHFSNRSESWFRSQAMYDFLDELVDDCFFEEFDQVMFYGVGASGYAAAAYSVVAPGANVLVIRPQATLDVERAGWDHRYPEARRFEFSDRFGYAPDMLEGAGIAVVLYDPVEHLDAVHASLFQGPNVMRLKCRYLRDAIDISLRQMGVLHQCIQLTAEGRLTPEIFYRLLRVRRNHSRYLRSVMYHVDREGHTLRTALVCVHVLQRINGRAFRRKLGQAREKLAARGKLPDWLLEFEAPDH